MGDNNRNTLVNYPCEDKPEAESKTCGGVESGHTTNENNAGKNFYLRSMLEEIVDISNMQKALKQVTADKRAG